MDLTYRGIIRGKTRAAAAWLFALLLVYLARSGPSLLGAFVCFSGALLRIWASGYLRKDTLPAVGGPYAYVRNPLYLGTYIMGLGVILSIENYILLGVTSVAFVMVYHFIILDEEVKLRALFGAPYLKYCELVPRFFPRLIPPGPASQKALDEVNPARDQRTFDPNLSWANKSYEAFLTFAGLMILVILSNWFWNR